MKKIVKKIKSLGIGGFTLIELLGVLVIMGILILVVMPNMMRLIHKNDTKDYTTYYDLIEFGATKYADDSRSTLGTTHDTGCTSITLDNLIKQEYVSAFSKNDITCSTGANGVVIRNENGKITVKFLLVCKKGSREVFRKGENDNNVCTAYEADNSENFREKLEASTTITKLVDNNITYITAGDNYVRFSGQMYQIVSYNTVLNTIKLVSVDPVSSIRYNGIPTNVSYTNSDIEMWLNNEYLRSLQPDYKDYLISSSWKPAAKITRKSIVGLITKEEYSKIKSWYGTGGSWLLDEGSSGNAYIANASTPGTAAVSSYHSVRPAITLNADVIYYAGNGKQNNPYVITPVVSEASLKNNDLNTRIPGEYVMFSGKKYRIMEVSSEGTKIISDTYVVKQPFAADSGEGSLNYLYDSSNLGLYLNSTWLDSQAQKNLLTKGDFCMDTINGDVTTRLSSTCIDGTKLKSLTVGLPKLGDLYAGPSSQMYWTTNPNTISDAGGTFISSTINCIRTDGTQVANPLTNTNTYARVVLYVDPSVTIESGKGTSESPFYIK